MGGKIAEALAARLARIEPKPLDHPEAGIAAWANPKSAHGISSLIDQHLKEPGATELTTGDRVVELDGCTFLRTDCYLVRRCGTSVSEHRIPVPICECCGSAIDAVGRGYGCDTGCHGDYRGRVAHTKSHSNTAY